MPIGEALAWADAALTHPSPVAKRFAVDLIHRQRDAWLSPVETVVKSTIVAQRLLPLARELGWQERAGDSDDLRDLRATLLPFAAETGDPVLRAQARELALAWIANREAVPATMTRAVLDTAARFAEPGLYEELQRLATSTLDLRERYYLLSALAKARDAALRERTLGLTLQKDLSGRDARDLVEDALEDEVNRRPAFDFLRANYDALAAKLPEHSMARLMEPLGEVCTREERELFAGFFKDRAPQVLGGPRHYRQSLERIDLCVAARNNS
jgi:alanyl aminopeptidase